MSTDNGKNSDIHSLYLEWAVLPDESKPSVPICVHLWLAFVIDAAAAQPTVIP